jgi:hypothetical protein
MFSLSFKQTLKKFFVKLRKFAGQLAPNLISFDADSPLLRRLMSQFILSLLHASRACPLTILVKGLSLP